MADEFISVPITVDEATLADDAVGRLQARWPDYEPNDGDLEVVMVEALAPMAANAAEVAASVPAAVFATAGTGLFRVPYSTGERATGVVRFIAIDTELHVVPANTEVSIDGWSFTTDATGTIPAGDGSVELPVTASVDGTGANGLEGELVSPLSPLAFLEALELVGTTEGGSDAETDAAYVDRLSRELELQARTLVVERDYELQGLSDPAVGRILALHDGQRRIKVIATTAAGEPLPQTVKDRLLTQFQAYRLVNTVITMADPTYTTITVTYTVVSYPGYDAVDLKARIDAQLASFLDPSTWGVPLFNPFRGRWVNQPVVRVSKIIDMIGNVEGVDYVKHIALAGNVGSAVANEFGNDWQMPGTVALTRSGAHAGTVTAS